jgi:hypothetical protein
LIEFDINSSLFFFSTFRHLPNGLKHKAVKTKKKINFKINPPPLLTITSLYIFENEFILIVSRKNLLSMKKSALSTEDEFTKNS